MPWEVTDYRVWRGQTKANPTAGALVLQYPKQVAIDSVWLVTGMVVICTMPVTGARIVCDIYDMDPTPLLTGGAVIVPCQSTSVGNKDVDDQGQPLIIPSGGSLWWLWNGADAGSVGSVRLQYEVAHRSGAAAAAPISGAY